MCETKVYLKKGHTEELLMEDVVRVIPRQEEIKLSNLFGQEKIVQGKIEEIQFLEHKITISPIESV